MSPAKPRRMVGYIRVSRVGSRDVEAENYITEAVQREKIETWAKLRDVEIVWAPVDRDQSGSKLSRPGFDWAMEQIRGGKADGIIVAAIDRLSRADVADALMIVRQIHDDYNGTLAAVDLGIDPTTEVGEMLLTVLLALARMQWRRYQAAWAISKERAIKRGVHVGAVPPGYRKTADGRLAIDLRTAPVVREAFRLAATKGIRAAKAHLIAAGLTSNHKHQTLKQRGLPRTWTTVTTRRLLTNRIYLGEISSGEIANKDAHEPLIDLATWTAAARAAGEALKEYRRGDERRRYALSHVLRCSSCGAPLVGNGSESRYRCNRNKLLATRRGEQEPCPAPVIISAPAVEEYVQAALLAHVATTAPDATATLVEAADQADVTAAEAVLRSAEMERDRDAQDTRLRSALGDEAFYARLEAHAASLAAAQAVYEAAASQASADVSWPLVDEIATAPIDELPGLLERCNLVVKVAPGRNSTLAARVSLEPRAGE